MRLRFSRVRLSLAAKCQVLFGIAVVLVIAASLLVPWIRMRDLVQGVNLLTAEGLAAQTVLDHAAHPALARPSTRPASTALAVEPVPRDLDALDVAAYIPPKLIPAHPPPSMALTKFDRAALAHFQENPEEIHFALSYRLPSGERYRLAMPLYADPSCIACHQSEARYMAPAATGPSPAAFPATAPTLKPLLGVVVVDIPSQVDQTPLFLNRVSFLSAVLIAGTLAVVIFSVIITRLILRPVRVLQDAADKVSLGDLNIRSHIGSGDEFQQLSETFNTMLANLKSSDEQLRAGNKALDLKLDQLAQSNVALYEANRLKSEFLANVSHELRTPLNSILGFADLLREPVSASTDAKTMRYLQNILAAGKHLLDLINDLLDLAKIEAGRMDVRAEPLSLGDVFEGLVGLLKPLAEARSLAIVPDVAADVPIVHTDPAKLQQVLYNLMSNAIKFSPPGGRVELVARTEGPDSVRIHVADHGPGIEPEKQVIIFEKFRQIDGSVTREHGGTGLGLAISRELTTLLGGTIGVASEVGQGATFWIVLPLRTQPGQRDVREKVALS